MATILAQRPVVPFLALSMHGLGVVVEAHHAGHHVERSDADVAGSVGGFVGDGGFDCVWCVFDGRFDRLVALDGVRRL